LRESFFLIFKTVRIETHTLLFGGTDRVFFQRLGEKNKKPKFVTRNPGNTMGVSGFGSFFCLWAVRARSNQWCMLTEPWATSTTAGAMKFVYTQQSTMGMVQANVGQKRLNRYILRRFFIGHKLGFFHLSGA